MLDFKVNGHLVSLIDTTICIIRIGNRKARYINIQIEDKKNFNEVMKKVTHITELDDEMFNMMSEYTTLKDK